MMSLKTISRQLRQKKILLKSSIIKDLCRLIKNLCNMISIRKKGCLLIGLFVFIPLMLQFKTIFPGRWKMKTTAPSGISNIDIVIIWSGISGTPKKLNGTDIRRERENGELFYLLRSIAKHAPWVRKVWILANGANLPSKPIEIPMSLKKRTSLVDRCTFMPNGTCPTRCGAAVVSFVHHLPGLSERFILAEDDIFLGRHVEPSNFFDDGKPFVWRKASNWGYFGGKEFHGIYEDPSVVSFSTPKSSWPSPHYWYPLLKSVCKSMEEQYPEFYAFVGSHTEGRYSSLAKGPSDEHNSQEEDFFGWMNWELLRTEEGVYKNIDSKQYEWWDEVEISERGFNIATQQRPIFMNVNDRFSKDEEVYKREIGWFHEAMESMFPKLKDNVIVGIGIPKAGTSKLDNMVLESFGLESCNSQWIDLKVDSARASMYCSSGKTIAHPKVKDDVLQRLGTECNYLGTHQDFSITHQLEGINVSYVTMLRDPIDRLVSGCNFDLENNCTWNTIVDFARNNQGYGIPNRMTKMIAGLDPVCSLEPNNITEQYASDDAALLRKAKNNLLQRFTFVGILERLPESIAQLPTLSNQNKVLSRLPGSTSSGGAFKGERKELVELLGPYIQLDQELYEYANQLLEKRSPCHPDQRFNSSDWYDTFATTIRSVRNQPWCPDCVSDVETMNDACARWWHPTPQRPYVDYPPRIWSGVLRPTYQNITKCDFGQQFRPPNKCTDSYRSFFRTLDTLRVVYFPRSGTELGIIRGSSYLSADGDVDLHVDMPQKMLFDKLSQLLEPAPHLEGQGTTAEVHWQVPGCPEVHMVYNDWISDELQHRAEPEDLCSCRMNSVELLCHRDGPQRMYTQYGPSWMVPLGVKLLDMPYWAVTHGSHSWTRELAAKLRTMVNTETGLIEPEAVSAIMSQTHTELQKNMPFILAQLNVLASSLGLYN